MVLRILPVELEFHVRDFHALWSDFPDSSIILVQYLLQSIPQSARTLVWALPISLAATLEIDVSFSSSAYLDVSVQRVPFIYLCIQYMMTEVFSAGFPHSDIGGSPDICSSPPLFAAYHVLLRLSVPRHPPCALSCLTFRHTVARTTWFLTSSRLSSFLKIRAYVLNILEYFFGCLVNNKWLYYYISLYEVLKVHVT